MTLGFSTHWPEPNHHVVTLFLAKILCPYRADIVKAAPDLLPKIHTFRLGHRWRAGMSIQMVTGNRTPKRLQFNAGIPALSTCISVQEAVIWLDSDGELHIVIGTMEHGFYLTLEQRLLFAANDGFNSIEEMTWWFFPKGPGILDGQIIHWTDFQYTYG